MCPCSLLFSPCTSFRLCQVLLTHPRFLATRIAIIRTIPRPHARLRLLELLIIITRPPEELDLRLTLPLAQSASTQMLKPRALLPIESLHSPGPALVVSGNAGKALQSGPITSHRLAHYCELLRCELDVWPIRHAVLCTGRKCSAHGRPCLHGCLACVTAPPVAVPYLTLFSGA